MAEKKRNITLIDYQPDFVGDVADVKTKEIQERMRQVGDAMICQNVDQHSHTWPKHCYCH